ncbi:hypothetical protein ACMD2_00484 [Ananas comosus]|uniref:Wound-responsive family protein n=1 Tax=Ananas comosus TaxID=4615 RepID=A0A199UFL5_ANACO|nr:hypothetical protein ACMD2_00484 [Ananas comosus]
MASVSSRVSLVVASSVGAVEALKDQAGLCRWNYALRSLHHRASDAIDSFSSSHHSTMRLMTPSSSPSTGECGVGFRSKPKRSEEKLAKAYHLICWGPN